MSYKSTLEFPSPVGPQLSASSSSTAGTAAGERPYRNRIVPVDEPRTFQIDELFFSRTNRNGIITSGNEIFARVSEYLPSEMWNKPHSLIRHPDMPRSVFKLFWDYLTGQRPIATYVKNMASDGRFYWVLALAAPVADGYLSIRFKPSSPLFKVIEQAYRDIQGAERAAEERAKDRNASIAAGHARLLEILKEHGFASYDAFMRTALYQELAARDQILERERRSVFAPLPPTRVDESGYVIALRSAHQAARNGYERIAALYAQLDSSARLNAELYTKAKEILALTGDFGLVSLNIAIKASRTADSGRSLGVIATHLGDASKTIAGTVSGLMTQVDSVSNWLGETVFSLAWARLQFEMVIVYYREMIAACGSEGHDAAADLENVEALRFALSDTITRAVQALDRLAKDLNGLDANAEDLRKAMLLLQVAHIAGLVEARRITQDDSFTSFFEDVRQQIDSTKQELAGFADVIAGVGSLARRRSEIEATMTHAAEVVKGQERQLEGLVGSTTTVPADKDAPTGSRAT